MDLEPGKPTFSTGLLQRQCERLPLAPSIRVVLTCSSLHFSVACLLVRAVDVDASSLSTGRAPVRGPGEPCHHQRLARLGLGRRRSALPRDRVDRECAKDGRRSERGWRRVGAGDAVDAGVSIDFEPPPVVVGAEPSDGRALPEQPEAVMTNTKPTIVRSRLVERTLISSPPVRKWTSA